MGCSFSLHQKVMDSSPKSRKTIEVLENARTLVGYFDDMTSRKSKKPVRCIFIFGGSGSSKGEFIWNLMKSHEEEEEQLEQMSLRPSFLLHPDESKQKITEQRKRFKFSYIDIEKLVANNIKRRIKELVRESNTQRGNHLYVTKDVDGEASSSSCDHSESQDDDEEISQSLREDQEYEDDMKIEKIKPYLTEFSNVVTCNWVLKLIESEIKKRRRKLNSSFRRPSSSSSSSSHRPHSMRHHSPNFSRTGPREEENDTHEPLASPDEPEMIFLVNLIPNRINLFKKCLYLNQTPNFIHVPFDYFAMNLTRVEGDTKKDLDVISTGTSFLDEANNTFVKYFRSINKLVEFRIKDDPRFNHYPEEKSRLEIKLTRKSDDEHVLMMKTVKQLKSLVKDHNSRNSGPVRENKVVLVNVDKFNPISEGSSWLSDAHLKVEKNPKSPSSPLIFMVENRIELEDYKVTILVEDTNCDINSIRPFINCLRQVLQETSEALSDESHGDGSRKGEDREMDRKKRSEGTGNEAKRREKKKGEEERGKRVKREKKKETIKEESGSRKKRMEMEQQKQEREERSSNPRIVIKGESIECEREEEDEHLATKCGRRLSVTQSVQNVFKHISRRTSE